MITVNPKTEAEFREIAEQNGFKVRECRGISKGLLVAEIMDMDFGSFDVNTNSGYINLPDVAA